MIILSFILSVWLSFILSLVCYQVLKGEIKKDELILSRGVLLVGTTIVCWSLFIFFMLNR